MKTQPQARMYLADQRGCSETGLFRTYSTFHSGHTPDKDQELFGPLHRFDDSLLRAGASLIMLVEADIAVVLIPVTGGLTYTLTEETRPLATETPISQTSATDSLTAQFLEPGQANMFRLTAGMTYTVSNPYETEYINFLQLWLYLSAGEQAVTSGHLSFDLTQKNTLLPLWRETAIKAGIRGFIGQYEGRQEGNYAVTNASPDSSGTSIFIFVLAGVFEVANRLLHEKDSLILWYQQPSTIEFEALSNEAILILIDLSTSN